MDDDLKNLLLMLRHNPRLLAAEEHMELGQILYKLFGTVERVAAELEALYGERMAIIRLDFSGTQTLDTAA